jgi:trimethylamine--corrinoid protein Co-methyltransferase
VFSAGIDQVATDSCLDMMIELGPGGSYLQHPSTVQNCRSLYMPEISDWNTYEDWEKYGAPDLLQIAQKKCNKILEESKEMILPVEPDLEIEAYLESAKFRTFPEN